jgi:elongation factor G
MTKDSVLADITKIRNIGIIAHIDAGKTTTSERILFYTGKEHKMGEVDNGNTTMDFAEDERRRGITIKSAATNCVWRDQSINLIDTPGHVDFTAEVERSLRVLDGAIGVFCAVGGVEPQSETVWRQANRYKVPRLAFINKMDRVGADFDGVLAAMRQKLHATPVVLTMPWGSQNDLCGVIDIIRMKALQFDEESLGKNVIEQDIPTGLISQAKAYYHQLLDTLANFDDEIIEKFSSGTLRETDIKKSLRLATLQGKIHPTLAGASFRNKGVQNLLDAVVDYLPSPMDMPPITGFHPKTEKTVTCKVDDEKLCALAYKTTFDKHGDITYIRIYSGTLEEGGQIYNPVRQKAERINRLCYFHADHLINCERAGAGEIVGVVGLKYTITGDTLCHKSHPVILERMQFPETVISKAVEPKVTADKDRLLEALQIIAKDDPTFRSANDEETGQIIISGMGELHLEIIQGRIQRDHRVEVNVGKPRVSYRETITKAAEGESRMQKQFGGREHFAYLRVKVEPFAKTLEIVNVLSAEEVPKTYHEAILDGIKSAASNGDLAGYPLLNIKVTIVRGEAHPTASSEMAFNRVAFEAFKNALAKAGCVLLEPIMALQIQTPLSYVGDVINNLHARRAIIASMQLQGDLQLIGGKVPLAEMFGYSNTLRTLTQGRGGYNMEPLEYLAVPKEIQDKLVW